MADEQAPGFQELYEALLRDLEKASPSVTTQDINTEMARRAAASRKAGRPQPPPLPPDVIAGQSGLPPLPKNALAGTEGPDRISRQIQNRALAGREPTEPQAEYLSSELPTKEDRGFRLGATGAGLAAAGIAPFVSLPTAVSAGLLASSGMVPSRRDPDAPPATPGEALGATLSTALPVAGKVGAGVRAVANSPVTKVGLAGAGVLGASASSTNSGELTPAERELQSLNDQLKSNADEQARLGREIEKERLRGGPGDIYKSLMRQSDENRIAAGELRKQQAAAQKSINDERYWKSEEGQRVLREREHTRLKGIEDERRGRPFAEKLFGDYAPAALPAMTFAGAALTGLLRLGSNKVYNEAVNKFMQAYKANDVPAMALHQAELRALNKGTALGKVGEVLATGLPIEYAAMEKYADSRQPRGTRAGDEIRERMSNPGTAAFDVGMPILSSVIANQLGTKGANWWRPRLDARGQAIVGGQAVEKDVPGPFAAGPAIASEIEKARSAPTGFGRTTTTQPAAPRSPQGTPSGATPSEPPAPGASANQPEPSKLPPNVGERNNTGVYYDKRTGHGVPLKWYEVLGLTPRGKGSSNQSPMPRGPNDPEPPSQSQIEQMFRRNPLAGKKE